MLTFLKSFSSITHILTDEESPYIRLFETEYNLDFRTQVKILGRRPTHEEAKLFILGNR